MVRKRGEKLEKWTSVLKRKAEEYCKSTSLHGFAYWVEANNTLERFFWFALTIASLVCAGLIISSAVRDWQENPGVTRIESFSRVRWRSFFKQLIGYQLIIFLALNRYEFPVHHIMQQVWSRHW